MERSLRELLKIPNHIRCGNCKLNDTYDCPMAYPSYYDDDGWTEVDLVSNNESNDFCSRFVVDE